MHFYPRLHLGQTCERLHLASICVSDLLQFGIITLQRRVDETQKLSYNVSC